MAKIHTWGTGGGDCVNDKNQIRTISTDGKNGCQGDLKGVCGE